TGTLGTLLTAAATGTRVGRIRVHATVTTTAGMVRIFLSTDGGTNKRLIGELVVTAITVGASTAAFEGFIYFAEPGLILKDANCIVYASTHNGETFNVLAEDAADF